MKNTIETVKIPCGENKSFCELDYDVEFNVDFNVNPCGLSETQLLKQEYFTKLKNPELDKLYEKYSDTVHLFDTDELFDLFYEVEKTVIDTIAKSPRVCLIIGGTK